MTKRKTILIVLDVVLIAILIMQCVFLKGDGSKSFTLKETPDEIILNNKGEEISLFFNNDNEWVVSDKGYPTNYATVDQMLDSIIDIKTIEKIGSTTKQGNLEKYQLDDANKITVVAKKDGEVLRTLELGKNASTGSQTYITLDGKNDIYLASGGLKFSFDKTLNAIRSKIVWDFDESEISSVEVRRPNGERYSVNKSGSGEELTWSVEGSDIELDTEKAQSWFDTLGTLTTDEWLDETIDNGKKQVATISIVYGYNTLVVDIYERNESTEENPLYYGICSENPYPFTLTSYTMERLNKNMEELAK